MRRIAALSTLILGLMAAAPALGAEQPLLLVVSDFDAALRREQPGQDDAARPATAAASQELEQILALLRQPRGRAFESTGPTARPH